MIDVLGSTLLPFDLEKGDIPTLGKRVSPRGEQTPDRAWKLGPARVMNKIDNAPTDRGLVWQGIGSVDWLDSCRTCGLFAAENYANAKEHDQGLFPPWRLTRKRRLGSLAGLIAGMLSRTMNSKIE